MNTIQLDALNAFVKYAFDKNERFYFEKLSDETVEIAGTGFFISINNRGHYYLNGEKTDFPRMILIMNYLREIKLINTHFKKTTLPEL